MPDVLVYEVADRVATVTLNRPRVRNALNAELRLRLPATLAQADADPGVDVVILTGADPAFCAGLDLKELGAADANDIRSQDVASGRPVPPMTKPLIGAINGVATTGGFELALNCSFLVASDRAQFADTHARVGVMPGWGLSVLLPQAVGVRKARELSATGNFLSASGALSLGLVNHVVSHDNLLPFCRQLAADIVNNDQAGVQQMMATYDAIVAMTAEAGWEIEAKVARQWGRSLDPREIERRRAEIVSRGRTQQTT